MGSHGGGNAEGQLQMLTGYGITVEAMGCPIQSSMEVVELPQGTILYIHAVCLSACVLTCLPACRHAYRHVYLPAYQHACLPACMTTYPIGLTVVFYWQESVQSRYTSTR